MIEFLLFNKNKSYKIVNTKIIFIYFVYFELNFQYKLTILYFLLRSPYYTI
jgi:hypothetical protein